MQTTDDGKMRPELESQLPDGSADKVQAHEQAPVVLTIPLILRSSEKPDLVVKK